MIATRCVGALTPRHTPGDRESRSSAISCAIILSASSYTSQDPVYTNGGYQVQQLSSSKIPPWGKIQTSFAGNRVLRRAITSRKTCELVPIGGSSVLVARTSRHT